MSQWIAFPLYGDDGTPNGRMWQNTATEQWITDAEHQELLRGGEVSPWVLRGDSGWETGFSTQHWVNVLTGETAALGDTRVALAAIEPEIKRVLALPSSRVSWWDKTQWIFGKYGIHKVAELANAGAFSALADFGFEQGAQLGAWIAARQREVNTNDWTVDLAGGAAIHGGNIVEMYLENPQMLLTAGAFGPAGSSLESDLWNVDTSASDAFGRPSEDTYQDVADHGYDTGILEYASNVGLMIGAAAAAVGLANAAGLGGSGTGEVYAAGPGAAGGNAFTGVSESALVEGVAAGGSTAGGSAAGGASGGAAGGGAASGGIGSTLSNLGSHAAQVAVGALVANELRPDPPPAPRSAGPGDASAGSLYALIAAGVVLALGGAAFMFLRTREA